MDSGQWEKIKEAFAFIVEQPLARRADLVRELSGDDDAFRRELESLLEAHSDADDQIVPDAFGLGAQLRAEAGTGYVGRTFGPYRILREIGRGGMGTVFLAERADGAFQRQVALKIIRRSLADPELERRFRRERQILATLNHPHIAHLLDGGVSSDGEPFFVMEYVDGLRIDEFCSANRLATQERLKLFLRVCQAVAHAHEQLVVHRDLKPSNILVTRDGNPKLLDFGIAKLLDMGDGGEQTATEYRAFTPDYAAPEQVRGEQVLTAATDVFSLGVLLNALLDPASAKRRTGTTASAGRIDRDRPTVPDVTQPPPGPELQNIVAMARRDEPERRYQSARELGDDIERYLDGRPILAQPDTIGYRTATFVRQRRTMLAAGVLTVAALAAGMAIATFYSRGDSAAPAAANPLASVKSIAVLPLKAVAPAASDDEEAAPRDTDQALRVGMADSIVAKLSQVRQLAVRPTSATVKYLDQDYDVVAVGRELQVDIVLEGTMQRAADQLKTNLQLVDVASGRVVWSDSVTSDLSNVLRGQESLASRVSQMLAFNVSGTLAGQERHAPQGSASLAAQDAFLRGTLALATSTRQVTNILGARDGFEQAIRLDPDFALAHAGLATAYTLSGSLTLLSPQDAYPRAERAARRALELDPGLAMPYVALAEIEADYNWNWEAAEANNRRALELAPNSSGAHQSYAEFLARMGRFAEADTHADLALQLDPTRINYVAVRALHYYYEQRFHDAITQSLEALAQDPGTYLAHLYISVSHAALGDPTTGLEWARKATALTGGAVPDVFAQGLNHAVAGDRGNTGTVLQRLTAMGRGRYVDPFHFVAIYVYLGDHGRAFEYLERSYAERSYWMSTLKVHPVVNALRGDPRFEEMMRRLKLD